ncbi:solute carrier family 23 member 2-like [Tachypleus tridentatus]|uniref:solute carrier family 23 member 2-like n=1 Tax=Tachypleus tridentatus TaxID=6853 RepID=UPI003FD49CDB
MLSATEEDLQENWQIRMREDETNIAEKEIHTTVDELKESIVQSKDKGRVRGDILYTVDEVPRWYLCVVLGIQQYLMMLGSTVACSYLLTPKLCIQESDPARGYITSTIFFVSGLGTLIQSTFGTRLPIIQGPSFIFLAPIFAILSLPQWKCPSEEEMLSATEEEVQEIWQIRMREIQGAIIVASIFEMVIGLTGVIGIMLQWLTPLVIVPTIALIGLSLLKNQLLQLSATRPTGDAHGPYVLVPTPSQDFHIVASESESNVNRNYDRNSFQLYGEVYDLVRGLGLKRFWFPCS